MKPSLRPDLIQRDKYNAIVSVPTLMNYVTKETMNAYTCRNETGSDTILKGVEWQPDEVSINSGRVGAGTPQQYTMDDNGFELMESLILEHIDFYNQNHILDQYYPHCEALLAGKFDGAAIVVAFDHNVRSNGFRRTLDHAGQAIVQNPLGVVHADYTRISAPRRLQQLSSEPKTNDVWKRVLLDPKIAEECCQGRRRFVFCNVWRNIKEELVQQLPLACIDAKSIHWNDLRTFQIQYETELGRITSLVNDFLIASYRQSFVSSSPTSLWSNTK
jgi:hypothetical protein